MNLQQKLAILSAAARYDVSCSSSGSSRKNESNGLGNGHISGICHSWAEDGRCISLLKILYSNECIYNCAYCANRCTANVPRATFTTEEVIDLTLEFYRRNYIEGLFLSSAIVKSPNHTMEKMVQIAYCLRKIHNFNGYIHMKAIPGADPGLIQAAGMLADRLSVNIELPSSESLKLLAPQKKKEAILKPMGYIRDLGIQNAEEKQLFRHSGNFCPAGQTTQLIVGATAETDQKILTLSEGLYRHYKLKRVYYSAYVPVSNHPALPVRNPPLLREHRLYQADWLLRFYGFRSDELLDDRHPNLDTELDPKTDWALRNLDKFPVEINRAPYEMLLRIPGIGVRSAKKIMAARRRARLTHEDLKKLGVSLKKARLFITCNGKFQGISAMDPEVLRTYIKMCNLDGVAYSRYGIASPAGYNQLSLFEPLDSPLLYQKSTVILPEKYNARFFQLNGTGFEIQGTAHPAHDAGNLNIMLGSAPAQEADNQIQGIAHLPHEAGLSNRMIGYLVHEPGISDVRPGLSPAVTSNRRPGSSLVQAGNKTQEIIHPVQLPYLQTERAAEGVGLHA